MIRLILLMFRNGFRCCYGMDTSLRWQFGRDRNEVKWMWKAANPVRIQRRHDAELINYVLFICLSKRLGEARTDISKRFQSGIFTSKKRKICVAHRWQLMISYLLLCSTENSKYSNFSQFSLWFMENKQININRKEKIK